MVMVSHSALVANIDMGPIALPMGPEDRTVAFLPSAHIAQRVVVELLPMRSGTPVTFAESLLKLPQDIKEVRPTIFLAPPRLWERIYSTICTELQETPGRGAEAFLHSGLALGLAAARYRRKNQPVPARIRVPAGHDRPAGSSQKCATVLAARYVWRLPAPRRWAPTLPSFTKPSACRWSKATG